MILTKEKGKRMWGGGFGSGGGGGMDASALVGLATESWVDENYVSVAYFNRLFQAFNGSTAVNPNDLTTAITNIKAMVDFWSAGAVSALGYGGGGGGGGATALSELVDVLLTNPTNGQMLTYNSTSGKWENKSADSTPTQGSDTPISSGAVYDALQGIDASLVFNATVSSGTAAVTTSPYTASIWRVDLSDKVTELYTGLTILLKVPVAGNGSYGTLLRIDGTSSSGDTNNNLYPVCANVTTMVGTRYAAGCIIALTFDASQTGQKFYYQSTAAYTSAASGSGWTKPGCWKIADYDANTNTIGYQLRTNSTSHPASDTSRYYKIFFTSADGTMWVPASANSTNNATSARAVNQRPINPWGPIVYTSASTNYTAGTVVAAATIWQQYVLTLGYSFNRTGAALTLTTNSPVYIKCAPQSDGSAIIDADTPYVQALPSTADGKIYIFLGLAASATTVEMTMEHPVYYYKDGAIRLWTNNSSNPGTVTSVAMTVPTGFSVSGSPITSSGTLALAFTSGYSLPTTAKQTQWDTAYTNSHTHSNKSVLDGITSQKVTNWDDAVQGLTQVSGYVSTLQGYFTNGVANSAARLSGTSSYTVWGQTYWQNGVPKSVSGALTSVTNITMTGTLRIGDGMLSWDSANNGIKVSKYDGTSAGLWAVGYISALGANTSEPEMIIGALPASGQTNVVYRVPGNGSYSDYMWNGSSFVLLATYSSSYDAGGALS